MIFGRWNPLVRHSPPFCTKKPIPGHLLHFVYSTSKIPSNGHSIHTNMTPSARNACSFEMNPVFNPVIHLDISLGSVLRLPPLASGLALPSHGIPSLRANQTASAWPPDEYQGGIQRKPVAVRPPMLIVSAYKLLFWRWFLRHLLRVIASAAIKAMRRDSGHIGQHALNGISWIQRVDRIAANRGGIQSVLYGNRLGCSHD